MPYPPFTPALQKRLKALEQCRKELAHLVQLLEPIEKDGALDVPGLATLNGARAALKASE